jgi:hypothetical protein
MLTDPNNRGDQMRTDVFRRIAVGLEGAVESAHMGHPDFRVGGKIFATLHADNKWGMVKLTPDQQEKFILENPEVFVPENGAWGRAGCTKVRLDSVDEDTLGDALTLAFQNTVRATAAPKSKSKKAPKPPRGAKR